MEQNMSIASRRMLAHSTMSSSSRPQSSKLLDLDITIVSAKHIHNTNWRQGDLKPYVSFWIEPGRRFTTKPDDAGSTRPVWNERFIVPINGPINESLLSLEINHSPGDPSLPVPLIGSVQFPIKELVISDESSPILAFQVLRPSGRPQGKIRVKILLRERERERPSPPPPEYHITPPHNYYYSTAPPPPARDYRNYPAPAPAAPPVPSQYSYSGAGYSDPYTGYYSSGYYSQIPPPPRPSFYDQIQASSYGGQSGPSAPVDYSYDQRDQRVKGSKMGLGTGLAVGAVAGALGGLALEEGLKHEEEKIAEKVERDFDGKDNYSRDNYSDYRGNY